jgi:ABC-type antimicrobial peptide transport system permease subunit
MNRCAAIYGALYFVNPSDINSKEYENRYKIFLQSAVLEDIKINKKNEEESYKNQIEEFKSSIKFFIQIFLQNYKKNNSYLQNHWLEDDFIICEKF